MPWGKSHETRIAILETIFIEFQDRMGDHMESEDSARKEIKETLKDVINHIDTAQKNNEVALNNMKGDVLQIIDKQYASKLHLSQELTNLRKSILKDMKEDIQIEKKRSAREIWLVVLGFCACLGLAAWTYTNIVKNSSQMRPAIMGRIDNSKQGFNDDKITY